VTADDLSVKFSFIATTTADITVAVSIMQLSVRFSSSITHCHLLYHWHHRVDYP